MGWNESLDAEIINISTPTSECLNLEVELHPSCTHLPFWNFSQHNFLSLQAHMKGMRRNAYILCEEETYVTVICTNTQNILQQIL